MKPDPLHCEINAWQHILDLLYSESVRRHAFEKFIATLSAPIGVISTTNSSSHSSINCDVETLSEDATVPSEKPDHMGASCEGDSERKNTSLSPGMIRQFSLREMNKNTAAENMTAMLENAEFHLSDKNSDVNGCGLSYLSTKVQEHYEDESKHFNKLSVRLIGAQAIALARYCYRLVDPF